MTTNNINKMANEAGEVSDDELRTVFGGTDSHFNFLGFDVYVGSGSNWSGVIVCDAKGSCKETVTSTYQR